MSPQKAATEKLGFSPYAIMSDLPAGLIVIGLIIEVVLVVGVLIWYRSSRKK